MNLVFVAIDTLRADHLSCYGYGRPTSSNIDAVAARGVLFEDFYSVGNCTHPGFTAMFTGMYPESTGIVNHWTRIDLGEDVPTMAERFARAGYQTAAIDNLCHGWVQRGEREYTWFRRGYQHYEYPEGSGFYQPSAECVALACDWLEKNARSPFLLALHVWNPHAPYNKAPKEFYRFYEGADPCDPNLDYMPPNTRRSQQRVFKMPVTDPGYVVAAYDAEIAYTDHSLGTLFERIEALGLGDDTLILITSDHGEIMARPRWALGRPWCFGHIGLHEGCLRLPLIIAGGPAAKGVRVPGPFQLVDIVPTLIDVFGLEESTALDGVSLAPGLSRDSMPARDAVFVSENTYQKQRAVMKWPWKYMRFEADYESMPKRSLFHLETDPHEVINLIDYLPDQANSLDQALNECVARATRGRPDPLKAQDVSKRLAPPEAATRY